MKVRPGDIFASSNGAWLVIKEEQKTNYWEVMTLGNAEISRNWSGTSAPFYKYLGNISQDVDWATYIKQE